MYISTYSKSSLRQATHRFGFLLVQSLLQAGIGLKLECLVRSAGAVGVDFDFGLTTFRLCVVLPELDADEPPLLLLLQVGRAVFI